MDEDLYFQTSMGGDLVNLLKRELSSKHSSTKAHLLELSDSVEVVSRHQRASMENKIRKVKTTETGETRILNDQCVRLNLIEA